MWYYGEWGFTVYTFVIDAKANTPPYNRVIDRGSSNHYGVWHPALNGKRGSAPHPDKRAQTRTGCRECAVPHCISVGPPLSAPHGRDTHRTQRTGGAPLFIFPCGMMVSRGPGNCRAASHGVVVSQSVCQEAVLPYTAMLYCIHTAWQG